MKNKLKLGDFFDFFLHIPEDKEDVLVNGYIAINNEIAMKGIKEFPDCKNVLLNLWTNVCLETDSNVMQFIDIVNSLNPEDLVDDNFIEEYKKNYKKWILEFYPLL